VSKVRTDNVSCKYRDTDSNKYVTRVIQGVSKVGYNMR